MRKLQINGEAPRCAYDHNIGRGEQQGNTTSLCGSLAAWQLVDRDREVHTDDNRVAFSCNAHIAQLALMFESNGVLDPISLELIDFNRFPETLHQQLRDEALAGGWTEVAKTGTEA